MRRMIVDTANVLFRVAAAHGKYNNSGTAEERAGLAMHISLNTLNKYYKQFKPAQVAVTFEGTNNWRKPYTKSESCVSGKVYKANRVKDPSMIPFFELIKSFEDLARSHTALTCLSHPMLEGDDLFAGYVRRFADAGDEVICISGDKDFVQLLRHPNVTLIDPDKGKPRVLDDHFAGDTQKNGEFFIFEKCFRGDTGDNVMSALPRVQKKRLLKAFQSDYDLTQLMNETWAFTDPETGSIKTYEVGELYKENKMLMDLYCQPEEIKQIIETALDEGIAARGKFSHFQFTKFCGKFGLKQIAENSSAFADLLSGRKPIEPPKKKEIIEF